MRMFTDGKRVFLRTPVGLVEWKPKKEPVLKEMSGSGISSHRRDGLLAITPKGADFTKALSSKGVFDAVVFNEKKVAALLRRDGDTVLTFGGTDAKFDGEIALRDVDGARVAWPDGLLFNQDSAADELYSEATGNGMPSTKSLEPTLGANKFGYAIASCLTGNVAVIRPNETEVSFAVRVPIQEESTVFAQPTKEGVLVSLCIAGQDAATLHLAEDGKVIGTHAAFASPPAVVLGKLVVVFDDETNEVRLLDAKSLQQKAKKAITFSPRDAAVSNDGKFFALGGEVNVLLGKLTPTGKISIVGQGDYFTSAKDQKRTADAAKAIGYDPKRAHGDSAIGFPAKVKPPPWQVQAGRPFELELLMRSAGGKGAGMFVQLEGDALKHLELSHVSCAGKNYDFADEGDAKRAELGDVELVEGLRYPLDPPPKNDKQKAAAEIMLENCHFSVKVHGQAKDAGRPLLRVSCGALESQASPMKWMRPLIID